MNKRILMIVQNLPVPFDSRVWQEARTLHENGFEVSVICPKGVGYEESYEYLEGIHVYRHALPIEAKNAAGYFSEYTWSLLAEFYLACKVYFTRGFDAIHACNPPDTIFLIGAFFKFLFGKKFVFDHHDLTPELFEAKFGKRGFLYTLLLWFERLSFRVSDISIATNESYREIAVTRGKMPPEHVFVVRSGPSLERMKIVDPVPALREGKKYLIGYVGVMGKQEGIEYLLEAARHIVHDLRRTDIHFTLAGSGPHLDALKQSAQDKNIMDYVTFAGRVSDEELLKILNTADICVNPDEVNAMNDMSTMNKVMEYMALGKPIVQFDMKEGRVSADAASLYAKANDAIDFAARILEIIDYPRIRKEMGAIGKRRIENELAWKFQAPKLLAAYDALFARKSLHEKLAWYYARLRAMSLQEIDYRLLEKFRKKVDQFISRAVKDRNYGDLPELDGLKKQVKEYKLPEALALRWQQQCAKAQAGQFFLLAHLWPECSAQEKWHLDPVTGKFWPKDRYCFAINYRHTNEYGDVKYVWELNRLQYLQPAAVLAFLRSDIDLAKFCISEIESWIDNNPPFYGINWASGIELAMRAISILFVITLLPEYITEEQRRKIWSTLENHALWISRYPSKFSSANNHQTAEALGLFLIGALCPAMEHADQWQQQGWELLCRSAREQILPDGTGAEQAISYTAYVLEMLLLGLAVARSKSLTIPAHYTERVEACAEHLRWFTDSSGNHPLVGDDDNARVLGSYDMEENYVVSVLGCAAAMMMRPDLAPPGNAPALRNILFGKAPPAAGAANGIRNFMHGGYTVFRHNTMGGEILLMLDHGPLGYLSLAAHGHADSLALWLHIDGQPILADAGTYLYHGGGRWRDYFRSTQAHNTLCLEKTGSSISAGNFNWRHKAAARLISCQYEGGLLQIEAEHDGYKKKFGAIHHRAVNVTPGRGFIVEDTLLGGKPHHVDIGFLIHPAFTVRQKEGYAEVARGEKVILQISCGGEFSQSLEKAWYSPRFGEKVPTQRIVFSGVLKPGEKASVDFRYFMLKVPELHSTATLPDFEEV